MNRKIRGLLPALAVIVVLAFFAFFVKGRVTPPLYAFSVALLVVLFTVVAITQGFRWLPIDDRWVLTSFLFNRNDWKKARIIVCGVIGGLALNYLFSMLVVEKDSDIYLLAIVVLLMACTGAIRMAVGVSNYLDSLAEGRLGAGTAGENSNFDGGEAMASLLENRKNIGIFFLCAAILFGMIFLVSLLRGAGMGGVSSRMCFGALASAFFVSGIFFSESANVNLTLCGLRRERDLRDGLRRDDDIFEAHRMYAHLIRKVAVVSAIVLYPTTFYLLYSILNI